MQSRFCCSRKCIYDQTSTSALQTTVAVTANVNAQIRPEAEHAVIVHLVGQMMEQRAAKVSVVCAIKCKFLLPKHTQYTHTPVSLDVDECASDNGGCHSKRKCVNKMGSHSCEDCSAGWANDGALGCKGLCLSLY